MLKLIFYYCWEGRVQLCHAFFSQIIFLLCGAAHFPCNKSQCCRIKTRTKKPHNPKNPCLLLVKHQLCDNICHQRRRARAIFILFFIPTKSVQCCPTEDPLRRKSSDVLSKFEVSVMNLSLTKYMGEIKTCVWL